MNDLVVKNVDLFGDTIVAAKDKNGSVWAGVKWLCEGLGLTEDQMRNERKKISKDVVLSKGGSNLTLPTKGGKQDVLCLRNDFVPLWLAKITVTPSMKENNPELVDKLVQYQLKAKDVLAEAFFPKEEQIHRLSPEEMMRIQLGMLDEQGERLGSVESRVDKLENTMTIDYGQQQELQSLAKAVAVNVVGGKKARAYTYQYPPADENDKQPKMYGMVISRLWHDYQDFFSVNSYKNTPSVRFDEALKYLNNWQPPINMQLEIGRINRMEDSENGN